MLREGLNPLAVAVLMSSQPRDAAIRRLFALAPSGGFWRDPSNLSLSYQDSAGTTPGAVDSPVGRAVDKSGKGNHATQSTSTSRPLLKEASGFKYDLFDGADDFWTAASGGGGTTGFFFCAAIHVLGGAGAIRAIFEDRSVTGGYIVRVNASNQLSLIVNNGGALVATTATLPAGETHIVTAWDDGTNLNAQIDSGTAATAARPVMVAGTAGFTVGRENGASAQYFNGRIYAMAYAKNYSPPADLREAVKRAIASKAGITL